MMQRRFFLVGGGREPGRRARVIVCTRLDG